MLLGLNRRWWGRCTGYFTGDERAHALSAENQPSQGKSAKASRRGCSCCCCNCKPTPCTSASHAFTGYALLVHPATSLCLPCVVSVSRSGSRSLRLPLYIFFLFILLFPFFRLFFFSALTRFVKPARGKLLRVDEWSTHRSRHASFQSHVSLKLVAFLSFVFSIFFQFCFTRIYQKVKNVYEKMAKD